MLLNSSTVEGTKAQPVRVPRRKTPVESQIGRNILASPNLNNEVSNDVYDTESADYGFALHNISEGEEDARSDSFPINAMKNLNLNKSPGQLNNQEDDNYVEVELSSRPKELTTAKLRKTAIKRHPSTLQMMTDAIKDIGKSSSNHRNSFRIVW